MAPIANASDVARINTAVTQTMEQLVERGKSIIIRTQTYQSLSFINIINYYKNSEV